jgi:SAM-dependent methyltransferase
MLQSEWLRPARARMLRLAGIQQASNVLDLGCGWGQVTVELALRSWGQVVGLDINRSAVERAQHETPSDLVPRLSYQCADAACLPYRPHSFDVVFCQWTLLWIHDRSAVLREIERVLRPRGALVAIEPDFGGLMAFPIENLRELWIGALRNCQADPLVGRHLLSECRAHGLTSSAYFLDRYHPFLESSLEFLRDLVSDRQSLKQLDELQQRPGEVNKVSPLTVHLPLWMVVARK